MDNYGPIFGRSWETISAMQQGTYVAPKIKHGAGDYGADPVGNGMFKMIPSGEIVTREEKERILKCQNTK